MARGANAVSEPPRGLRRAAQDGLLAGAHLGRHAPWLFNIARDAFESREPIVVVMRAVIGLATIARGFEFIGKRAGPFLPCEMSLFEELDGQSERLPSHGSANTGPPESRGRRGSATMRSARAARSGRLKVVVP
jgi:hypothetical protein